LRPDIATGAPVRLVSEKLQLDAMGRASRTATAERRPKLAAAILRDARRRAGLTQVELSERAGVVRPLISQYENGRKDPSVTMLARLIAACGMELRVRAEILTDAERSQRAHDEASTSSGQARRNSARARREVVSVRKPTAAELERLRSGGRAAS
jgi:transcriptional regulator with XRE-family HTH domain